MTARLDTNRSTELTATVPATLELAVLVGHMLDAHHDALRVVRYARLQMLAYLLAEVPTIRTNPALIQALTQIRLQELLDIRLARLSPQEKTDTSILQDIRCTFIIEQENGLPEAQRPLLQTLTMVPMSTRPEMVLIPPAVLSKLQVQNQKIASEDRLPEAAFETPEGLLKVLVNRVKGRRKLFRLVQTRFPETVFSQTIEILEQAIFFREQLRHVPDLKGVIGAFGGD